MGIPGILKEIGKGERIALAKLATEHLERTNRPLRIAIDAAIWNFQHQASQGGKNPALRTLFFRLLKLLALPIHPVFVYDGKDKPLTKRGKTVSRYGSNIENEMAKQLLRNFRFPYHSAPGEAEAECALLQKRGIVDAVMSQDVDAIMFGSDRTIRDWSKEGTRGNKSPTHVNVLDLAGIKKVSGLDPQGMILVALLSGGDYNEVGLPGFGPTLACEIARAGFGIDLIDLARQGVKKSLSEWRDRLEHELHTNESGYFRKRHLRLVIPEDFPNQTILKYYTDPVVSAEVELRKLENEWERTWAMTVDVSALRQYVATMFDWTWRSGAERLVRCLAQPLFQNGLFRCTFGASTFDPDCITESRKHFSSDGITELRFQAVPANVVGLDLNLEEDGPGELQQQSAVCEEESELLENVGEQQTEPVSPSKRISPPWNPRLPEKWWIPETLLKIGLSMVVETWYERQREIMNDPRKFAKRKVPKAMKPLDSNMETGAIRSFLQPENIVVTENTAAQTDTRTASRKTRTVPCRPTMPTTPRKSRIQTVLDDRSPSITRFFKPTKLSSITSGFQGSSNYASAHTARNESLTDSLAQRSDRPRTADMKEQCPRLCDTVDLGNPDAFTGILPADDLANIAERKRQNETIEGPAGKNMSSVKEDPRPGQRSVAGFFQQHNETEAVNGPSEEQIQPYQSFLNSAKSTRTPLRVAAVSRESLPGAWQILNDRDIHAKRVPRVSHVDLTGE